MPDGLSQLSRLYDRLSTAIAKGRGVQFTPSDVDWLVLSGAYGRLLEAVAREAYVGARARVEAGGVELNPLLFGEASPVTMRSTDNGTPD